MLQRGYIFFRKVRERGGGEGEGENSEPCHLHLNVSTTLERESGRVSEKNQNLPFTFSQVGDRERAAAFR